MSLENEYCCPSVHNIVNGYGDPCPPRFGPDLDLNLGNKLAVYEKIGALLGKPLLPWQKYVCQVLSEVTHKKEYPNWGLLDVYKWPKVDYTVSRQNGKTFLTLVIMLVEMLAAGRSKNIMYSAQTGQQARIRLEDEFVKILRDSKFYSLFGFHFRGGVVGDMLCKKTGSKLYTFAGSDTAGHGATLDVIVNDELFAILDNKMDIALDPTQKTIPDARKFRTSAASDESNEYFVETFIDKGRENIKIIRDTVDEALRAELIRKLDTTYIEWSAPIGADIENPEVWKQSIPSLGFLFDIEKTQADFNNMSETVFRRTVLNQVLRTGNYDAIPEGLWNRCLRQNTNPKGNRVVLAYANSKTGDKSSAVICGSNGEAQLVEHYYNIEQMKKTIPLFWNNRDKNGITHIVVKNESYFGGITAKEFEEDGIPIVTYTDDDYKHACMRLLEVLVDDKLVVEDSSDIITGAVRIAQKSETAAPKWKWSTLFEDLDLSGLEALTLSADYTLSNLTNQKRQHGFAMV